MPNDLLGSKAHEWEARLSEMEDWYKDLLIHPNNASNCFARDYSPFEFILSSLTGDVLDVGGGIGIPRHYLNCENYIVLDPSLEWLKMDWSNLSNQYPSLNHKPNFIRGIGEYLPFRSASFDAVLSFWSLNHAINPELVMSEMARVLRPGGRALLVLEEMIPTWSDVWNPVFPIKIVLNSYFNKTYSNDLKAQLILSSLLLFRRDFPLQIDHIRIFESEFNEWVIKSFKVIQRKWVYQYLTYELQRFSPLQLGKR